jgi:NADP-dependent 3-hydroxy acid dehydrogenase YdfG
MDHAVCGNIININSMSGHRVVNSINTHFYSATKYAVTALTEGTRQELRRLNSKIRANQISPGFVDTDFFNQVSQDQVYLEKMKKIAENALSATDICNAVMLCLKAAPSCQVGDIQLRPTVQLT